MRNLLDLPNEILKEILLYLSHDEILEMANVALRLKEIVVLNSLWTRVYFRNSVGVTTLKKSLKYMGSHTEILRITGFSKARKDKMKNNLSISLFQGIKVKCVNLRRLILEDIHLPQNIAFDSSLLPDSLVELRINSSCNSYYAPYSCHGKPLVNLRHLAVENCSMKILPLLVGCLRAPTIENISFKQCREFKMGDICSLLSTRKAVSTRLQLEFSNCSVNDTVLFHIQRIMPRIGGLSLAHNSGLTDRGLDIIVSSFKGGRVSSKSLEYLNLTGTGTTMNGLERAKLVLPSCQIIKEDTV